MNFIKNLSISSKVLLGALFGVLTGLFFGEHVAWMSTMGNVFIGLLQMTVLPYIMFSLITNIGRLSMETGKKLVIFGLKFLGLLLSVGLVMLFVLPFAFPEWGTGSFYSNEVLAPAQEFDFVKLYVPTNIFESLTNNVVPAVVLFSIFLGIGLMNLKEKELFLKPLEVVSDALNQVNKMVVKITPIGVFAIGAGVVTELSFSDLSRLQGYLLIYLLGVVLLTFLVLPLIISFLTPFSPKEVLRIVKPTLVTIFATGKIIVVYPQLIENIKEILATRNHRNDATESEVDIIMPLAYPFPNLGTFLIFIFVPFAAWYSGKELIFSDYPLFLSSTLLSSFVAPITGLPFSLDLMGVSQETFQLFVVSTVLTDRIRVVLGAFHLVTLTLLTVAASNSFLKLKWNKMIFSVGISVLLVVGSTLGLQSILKISMGSIPTNKEMIGQFSLITPQQPYEIIPKATRNPNWKRSNENIIGRIIRKGALRVGFYKNSVPFSFYNDSNQLVGFGIDLAHRLAADLDVSIEFVPVTEGKIIFELQHDYYDIVMSDIFLSSQYAQEVALSKPYLPVSLSVVVPKNQPDFDDYELLLKLDSFTLGYLHRDEIARDFLSYFPNGGMTKVESYDSYFDSLNTQGVDGLLTFAEKGYWYTIQYPEFKVVFPTPGIISNALVFPMVNDNAWVSYLNKWIDYRTNDGSIDKFYKQWILGKPFKKEARKWNVFDDWLVRK